MEIRQNCKCLKTWRSDRPSRSWYTVKNRNQGRVILMAKKQIKKLSQRLERLYVHQILHTLIVQRTILKIGLHWMIIVWWFTIKEWNFTSQMNFSQMHFYSFYAHWKSYNETHCRRRKPHFSCLRQYRFPKTDPRISVNAIYRLRCIYNEVIKKELTSLFYLCFAPFDDTPLSSIKIKKQFKNEIGNFSIIREQWVKRDSTPSNSLWWHWVGKT